MLLIQNIKLDINQDELELRSIVENILKTQVKTLEIYKKSLDARKKPIYVYSVLVDVDNEDKYLRKDINKFIKEDLTPKYIKRDITCAVIGYGPSGIFSAYRLCQAGFKVKVFEKGKRIDKRQIDVNNLFNKGILDENSNVQFGEGGAGTFSDAKLTTRIKDKYIDYILDVFIKHGAKKSIKYEHHPHIGTDEIRKVITNITDYLIDKGCDFHFEEELIDIDIIDGTLKRITTNKDTYNIDYCLLGVGHSSYKTICMLKDKGVYIEPKDISIGFRVEHPQTLIDKNQTNNLIKEANEYFLRYKANKGVYSFCMCPGGIVIPAMSENNTIVTNGMSYSKRDSGIANSAILIQKPCSEFDDGYNYLQTIERNAFNYSNSFKALAQNIKDFINNDLNELIFKSTYPLDTVLYDFNNLFNKDELEILKNAFYNFNKKIPGFINEGIMVGPETRSSCPIRIKRNDIFESINTKHLFPMGEGSGYGGGIMSCALDGIRIANRIILNHE